MRKKLTESNAEEILVTMKARELLQHFDPAFGTRMIILRNVIEQEIEAMMIREEDDEDSEISQSMGESLVEALDPFCRLLDFYESISEEVDDETESE
jgi:hypothetical protein